MIKMLAEAETTVAATLSGVAAKAEKSGDSSEGIQKLTTNVLTSDIASMGPKHFARMPTLGMGHGLGGSVIIEPQKEFSSSVGDFSWGGMASTYFWIDRVEKLTTIFFFIFFRYLDFVVNK